jgi:hypothetical protein
MFGGGSTTGNMCPLLALPTNCAMHLGVWKGKGQKFTWSTVLNLCCVFCVEEIIVAKYKIRTSNHHLHTS